MKRGDNVYVRRPQRFVVDCTSITGDVIATHKHGRYCTIDAYIAKMGGGYPVPVTMLTEDLGIRNGTPISQISIQPGVPEYSEWLRISRSCGHP